jgi:monofunctional biosynthetic peptidoglycan transglycosylase
MLLSVLWVLLLGAIDPPVTWVMAEQASEQKDLARTWKDLDEIARTMPLAVIASEDQKFFEHHGFDLEAIEKAMAYNERKKGRRVRGASTISQQVAKNVFLWPGRSWLRKGCEVWFTVLIETLWTKERIMEVYLNVAETGKGRFGVEAAAQACFGRPASKLTSSQAALIAVVIPAPRRYSCTNPGSYTQQRQRWVVRNMSNLGDLMDPEVRRRNRELQERKENRSRRG